MARLPENDQYRSVDVHPVQTSRRVVKFEYAFDSGETHHLTLYPLKQNYMSHLLEDAGFMDVTRYGYFERIGRELVDRTSRALQFWVDRANEQYIGWLYVVARK